MEMSRRLRLAWGGPLVFLTGRVVIWLVAKQDCNMYTLRVTAIHDTLPEQSAGQQIANDPFCSTWFFLNKHVYEFTLTAPSSHKQAPLHALSTSVTYKVALRLIIEQKKHATYLV